jgi:hypothetical protein
MPQVASISRWQTFAVRGAPGTLHLIFPGKSINDFWLTKAKLPQTL